MAVRCSLFCLVAGSAFLSGCRAPHQTLDREYAGLSRSIHHASAAPIPELEAVSPVVTNLEGPHAVEEYIQYALEQNPEVQAARKRMEAAAYRVPVVASLQDPMVNLTVQPEHVQTAAGQQELILSASQKFHWFGKLGTRASVAEMQTNVKRAELAAAELGVIATVKRAYYELYFIQQAISVTQAEQNLLGEIRDVADARYRAAQTSQQDVLRADLEISNVENELIRLQQQLVSGQARLARVLHVAPQSEVMALNQLPPEQLPRDLQRLQQQAVAARPELHAQLAAVQRDRQAVELARLDYKPDMTFGFSWIDVSSAGISPVSNGRDALLLTTGINLPIYKKRLDSSVRSAEAKAVSTAREYDAVRDGTLESVTDLFSQAQSQRDLLMLFEEDILPKARQTLDVSSRAYNVGHVDFLQLIDNWRQVLRYEVSYRRLEASLRQTLAELERVVGGFIEPTAEPLPAMEEPQPLPPVP